MEWRELFDEAVVRALSTRCCPRDVDPARFLISVMRSIASHDWERSKKSKEVAVGGDQELDQHLPAGGQGFDDEGLSAEDYEARLAAVDALFADDEEAQMVIMGLKEEASPADIRAAFGWNTTQYATIRKRMRRALTNRFGGGWSA